MFLKRIFIILMMLVPVRIIAQQAPGQDSVTSVQSGHQYNNALISYIPPVAFITYGVLSFHIKGIRQIDYDIHNDRQADHPNFKTNIDDITQFVPAIMVYGLNIAGVKGKHNFADRTALYVLSEGIFAGTTFITKRASNRLRPNGADRNSFPSGHTGNAFASAEFLNQEYGDISPWYSVAGYTLAATTATLRIYNNAHWFSDVVAGAGIGILSTKLSYLLYPVIKKQFSHKGQDPATGAIIMPTYQDHMFGLVFVQTL
ncbi:phosphatase PAP2 family protein [Mucilaginibacter pineti]|nr:phosphatase PAP2 family protein [Mucilaginibacter pineti]